MSVNAAPRTTTLTFRGRAVDGGNASLSTAGGIAGAAITICAGSRSFTGSAGDNGNFSVPVTILESETGGFVSIAAVGGSAFDFNSDGSGRFSNFSLDSTSMNRVVDATGNIAVRFSTNPGCNYTFSSYNDDQGLFDVNCHYKVTARGCGVPFFCPGGAGSFHPRS